MNGSKLYGIAGLLFLCLVLPARPHDEACPLGNCGQGTLVDPPSPCIRMKVRVAGSAKPGQELEYRVFLENVSPADAHHVVVKCPLPAGVKFVRASPVVHQKEPELQWHLGTMHGHGKCEISLVLVAPEADDLKVCFRVQYEFGLCVTTRLSEQPPGPGEPPFPPGVGPDGKPRPPQIKPVPPTGVGVGDAKLSLKMDGPKERPLNMPAKYFLTVLNEGKGPATNLLLRAALPDKTEFVSASDDGVHVAGQVAWLLKELPAGQKWTVELIYRSKEPGERCVKASVLADRNLTAQAELCTTFAGVSALFLEMVDREDPIAIGGDTSFPIIVVNTGAGPVTNLKVKALVPPQMVLSRTQPAEHQLGERIPQGQWITFAPSAALQPGGRVDFEVFVKGVQVGDARFRIEMSADQLERGPVTEVESTHIFQDENQIPVRMLSRKRR